MKIYMVSLLHRATITKIACFVRRRNIVSVAVFLGRRSAGGGGDHHLRPSHGSTTETVQTCNTRSVCKPRSPAYIRGLACIQGLASISTTALDPRPLFKARLIFKARLVCEEIRYVNFHSLILISWPQYNFHLCWMLMHILNNSWCDWECTGVLQCLSCNIHRKSCYCGRDDTTVWVLLY